VNIKFTLRGGVRVKRLRIPAFDDTVKNACVVASSILILHSE
jgi:hypothetical protein